MLHGHLDVVPAEASDWSVHPFSGAVEDGYVWGRGAVDMKDMVGMMIAVARHFKRVGHRAAPRPGVRVRLRRGGRRHVRLQMAGRQPARPVRRRHRGDRRGRRVLADDPAPRRRRAPLYLIETAEKAMMWMRLTARGRAGHGSMIHDDNAVTAVAEAVARLGRHQFPVVLTESVEQFLAAVTEETGYAFDVDSPDLEGAIAKLGPIARIVGATLRDTANPTMLKAGYKANVIPATAEAVVDCRVLPGRLAAFEREVDEIIGPDVTREWITELPSYETSVRRRAARGDERRDPGRRPRRAHGAVHAVRRYRCKTLRPPGDSLLRVRAAEAAARPRLRRVVPRRRRAGTRRRVDVRHPGSRTFPDALLTTE